MARAKLRYMAGDLVEVTKTERAGRGSLTELKPPQMMRWNMSVERKSKLIVIRHEEGGGTQKFKGSVLCISPQGFIWIDSRIVVMVIDKDGCT